MRRNVKNKKVLRAITIGLAAVLSVTSTPITAFAEGVDGTNGVQPSGTEETTTTTGSSTESTQGLQGATSDATFAADAAEGKAGTLSDTTPATGTGTVGTSVANALNDVASGEAVLNLYEDVSGVEKAVDKLTADVKAGKDGLGQIKNSETLEGTAESKFGVELNADGTVKNQDGLDKKVSNANNKIDEAETAKKNAYDALYGKDGLNDKINTAEGLISTANTKKKTADDDTTTANTAIAGISALDSETQSKLNDIETELDKVIYDKDGKVVLEEAVGSVTKAAGDAAKVASDNLTTVQNAFQKAKGAADDAVANSGSYTYQQMATLANNAQIAANNAKTAADLADKAVEALETKETEARKALTDSTNALSKAQGDAAEVLKAYKKTLDEINNKIDAANVSRAEAKTAMKNANNAIDDALKLMEDTSDPSAETVKKKIEAMDKAIVAANTAINTVAGLTKTKEFTDAENRHKWTKQRLDAEIEKLETAETTYAAVIEAKKEATDYQESAQLAVNAIDEIMNGKDGKPGWFDAQIAEVDNDLKALLSTGGAYSYQDLQNTANGVGGEVKSQGDALVNLNKELGGSEEDQNLTADQIVTKYDNAVSANETLDTQISEKRQIINDCNSNEGTVKTEYDNADGELRNDITALQAKYVGEYNAETHEFEFKTDKDGKPVYSDSYNALLTRSEATEFKCGDEVLSATAKPAYTDADGNKYMRDGGEDISVPEWIKSDKVQAIVPQAAPVTVVGIDTDANKLVETVPCNFVENYGEGDSVFRSDYYYKYKKGHITCETKLTDATEVKKVILAEALSNVLHAELTTDDVNVDGLTATVTLTKDNASRLQYTQSATEQYTLNLSMYGNPKWTKQDDGSYDLSYNFNYINFAKDGAIYYGAYETTRTYDYKKYEEKSTADALAAKEELSSIDKAADDTAKQQIKGHGETRDEKYQALQNLRTDRANAAKALYGYGTEGASEDNPAAGSLLNTYNNNQTIIGKLGTNVSQYTLAVRLKTAADENLKKADDYIFDITGLSAEDKETYKDILKARQTIIDEKSKANDYLTKLKKELGELDRNILAADGKTDGVAAYNRVAGKIATAGDQLTTVKTKINSLKTLQTTAVEKIKGKGTLVDSHYSVGDETYNIEELNTELAGDLKGLKKFDDVEKYNPIENVSDYRKLDELSLDVVNGDLAGKFNNIMDLITGQSGILKETVGTLENISEAKKKLLSDVEKIHDFAKKAQDEADRAATALKNWRAPYVPGDDDDDEESSSDTGIIYTNQGVTITGLDLTAIGAGTGTGIRTVAGARTGVAGVRAEADIQNPQVPLAGSVSTNSNTTTAANGEETTANIGDNLVPLAKAPFEKGTEMNLAWLLSLAAAAAAGVGVYAYDRRRKLANAEEEAKKYKK